MPAGAGSMTALLNAEFVTRNAECGRNDKSRSFAALKDDTLKARKHDLTPAGGSP